MMIGGEEGGGRWWCLITNDSFSFGGTERPYAEQ